MMPTATGSMRRRHKIPRRNLEADGRRAQPQGRQYRRAGILARQILRHAAHSSFLNENYQSIFEVLETNNEVAPLLGPFQTALKNKAMKQLEGIIGTLRVYASRLTTKELYNLNENMDSLVPASKISDMPIDWICGQSVRDFVQTKVDVGGSMNIQEPDEFKTSKFFCKTDLDRD